MKRSICVYGASSDNIPEEIKKLAYELGKEIAEHDCTLIYGAGGSGVMGSSAQGAYEAGGKVLGITPRFMDEFQPINVTYCTDLIWTEDMAVRKEVMESNADAFVIAPGGIGTYDEFFQALTLKELKRHNKQIIVCNFMSCYDSILAAIDAGIESGYIKKLVKELFVVVTEPKEIFDYIF